MSTSNAPVPDAWGDFAVGTPWSDDPAVVFQCRTDEPECDDDLLVYRDRLVIRPTGDRPPATIALSRIESWEIERTGVVLLLRLCPTAGDPLEARLSATFEPPLTRTLTRLLGHPGTATRNPL